MSEPREVRIVRGDAAPRGRLRNDRGDVIRLVGPEVGARAMDLHVNVLAPGREAGPYHRHTNAENAYLVLEGRVAVRAGGIDHVLDAGDAAFVPPGVPHSARNAGPGEARLVEVYAPADADFEIVSEDAT